MPSISMVTLSPDFIKRGGLRAMPTPCGVPVMMTVPGSSVVSALRKAMRQLLLAEPPASVTVLKTSSTSQPEATSRL